MQELAEWDSFYLIVGGAAGALIGLQFVVMTLISERPQLRSSDAGSAFATPNIVHFGTAFLLSALMRVPWKTVIPFAVAWALVGVVGIIYALIVARRIKTQTAYEPVFEDWTFHVVLPFAAYLILAVSAFFASSSTREALFGVGGSAILLLFIAIHNAWDATTYNIFVLAPKADVPTTADSSEEVTDSEQT
jgi:hypothetical protein